MKFHTDDLMNQARLAKKIRKLSKLGKWPGVMKAGAWQTLVQSRLDRIRKRTTPAGDAEARRGRPADDRPGRLRNRSRDELMAGNPYYNEETGLVWFRLATSSISCAAPVCRWTAANSWSG